MMVHIHDWWVIVCCSWLRWSIRIHKDAWWLRVSWLTMMLAMMVDGRYCFTLKRTVSSDAASTTNHLVATSAAHAILLVRVLRQSLRGPWLIQNEPRDGFWAVRKTALILVPNLITQETNKGVSWVHYQRHPKRKKHYIQWLRISSPVSQTVLSGNNWIAWSL